MTSPSARQEHKISEMSHMAILTPAGMVIPKGVIVLLFGMATYATQNVSFCLIRQMLLTLFRPLNLNTSSVHKTFLKCYYSCSRLIIPPGGKM